jgi:ATP-dependent Clp protease adaptor protein ClpS
MADTDTLTQTEQQTSADLPWNVIVHDDPVNLKKYIIFVLMEIFSFDENRANTLMLEVKELGRSAVWSGEREMAEFYVQQLQAHQLKSTMEKAL